MEDGRCKLGLPGRLKSVVAALAGYQRERAGVALVFAIASAAARSCRWALSSETEALTLTAPERTSRIGHVQQGWLVARGATRWALADARTTFARSEKHVRCCPEGPAGLVLWAETQPAGSGFPAGGSARAASLRVADERHALRRGVRCAPAQRDRGGPDRACRGPRAG